MVNKEFTEQYPLKKIFNKNTLKLSCCYMNNIERMETTNGDNKYRWRQQIYSNKNI